MYLKTLSDRELNEYFFDKNEENFRIVSEEIEYFCWNACYSVFFSGFTVLFDDSHKVIGAAGFSISEDNVVSLSFVTVSKKHRSNGYSKLIIEEMFKFFNEYGVVKIINSSYSFTELDNYNETGEVRLKKNINSLMESYPNIELVESSRRHWVPDDIVMNRMNLNRA